MNGEPNISPEEQTRTGASGPGYNTARGYNASVMRSFLWSVRRELWENKSLYIAPLIVMGVELFGFAVSTIGMPSRRSAVLLLAPAKQKAMISEPYDVAATMLIFTALIVGIFYCLDALYGERRDRSILFWKSLPVSDLTTVLAKLTVAMVILPVITFIAIIATQFIMLLWSSAVLFPSGFAGTTWTRFNLLEQSVILLYSLAVISLWYAPIYGWLLIVSAWARRATFLCAVLPPLAIAIFEKITFNSSHFASFLGDRLAGFMTRAFGTDPHQSVNSILQLTPGRFLSAPGLWAGLIVAAGLVFAASALRRYRGPI